LGDFKELKAEKLSEVNLANCRPRGGCKLYVDKTDAQLEEINTHRDGMEYLWSLAV
jgi:hypothetical protein